MRSSTDRKKIERVMLALGRRITGGGTIFITGGGTALLHGWRDSTIDLDIKADPEPRGLFEAIASLKIDLDVNIELASPDLFIPAIPGWRDRSKWIARHGLIDFHHYDFYGQALSKIERGHDRDLLDVRAMQRLGLVDLGKLWEYFLVIEPELIRYPGLSAKAFRTSVEAFITSLKNRKT